MEASSATPLRKTLSIQYPLVEEETDTATEIGERMGASFHQRLQTISEPLLLEPPSATPLRQSVLLQYPVPDMEEETSFELTRSVLGPRASRIEEGDIPTSSSSEFNSDEIVAPRPAQRQALEATEEKIQDRDRMGASFHQRLQTTSDVLCLGEQAEMKEGGDLIRSGFGAHATSSRQQLMEASSATPLRKTLSIQYPLVEEEAFEDAEDAIESEPAGTVETGEHDVDTGCQSSQSRPVQYGQSEKLTEVIYSKEWEIRNRIQRKSSFDLLNTITHVSPKRALHIENGGVCSSVEEDSNCHKGQAREISIRPVFQPRGYTPLRKAVSRKYPVNTRREALSALRAKDDLTEFSSSNEVAASVDTTPAAETAAEKLGSHSVSPVRASQRIDSSMTIVAEPVSENREKEHDSSVSIQDKPEIAMSSPFITQLCHELVATQITDLQHQHSRTHEAAAEMLEMPQMPQMLKQPRPVHTFPKFCEVVVPGACDQVNSSASKSVVSDI